MCVCWYFLLIVRELLPNHEMPHFNKSIYFHHSSKTALHHFGIMPCQIFFFLKANHTDKEGEQ